MGWKKHSFRPAGKVKVKSLSKEGAKPAAPGSSAARRSTRQGSQTLAPIPAGASAVESDADVPAGRPDVGGKHSQSSGSAVFQRPGLRAGPTIGVRALLSLGRPPGTHKAADSHGLPHHPTPIGVSAAVVGNVVLDEPCAPRCRASRHDPSRPCAGVRRAERVRGGAAAEEAWLNGSRGSSNAASLGFAGCRPRESEDSTPRLPSADESRRAVSERPLASGNPLFPGDQGPLALAEGVVVEKSEEEEVKDELCQAERS